MTTLIGSPSAAFASSGIIDLVGGAKGQTELRRDLYAMPAEFATLVSLWEPTAGVSQEGFVIQIQDAHANPEGQQNVARMLKYLEAKFPALVVGLEGATGELHPEYLEFFKEFPDANQAMIEDLKQKGELNGAELFLLGKDRISSREIRVGNVNLEFGSLAALKRTEVRGVETTELYRDNLRTFRDLLSRRDEMQTLLNPIRAQLEKESSQKLNGELRDFLKERSRRKEGRFDAAASQGNSDLQAYVRYLEKQASKVLEINLRDTIEQLRFPSFLRVVMIEDARKGFDPELAKRQWEKAIQTIESVAKDSSEKEFAKALAAFGREKGFIPKAEDHAPSYLVEPALYPRKLLEGLFRFAQKHQLSFAGQEAFWQSWKLVALQAEIDASELLQEMSTLEEGLIQKLARSEKEKALVQKIKRFDLLEKTLRLELSREEYNQILLSQEGLKSFAANSKPLAMLLGQAYHFYDVSIQRDEALVTNLLKTQDGGNGMKDGGKQLAPSYIQHPSSKVFVLYSGGFHTPGVEERLRAKNIGYAVFSPRITKTDHGEMYQKVMSDANADLSAYFKVRNPFLTKQEALIFKQLIETAAPVLSEKYQLKPDQVAARVAQAVKEHPVLSGVVDAARAEQGNNASVRFQPKPDLQTLIPQNSSVMPSATLSSDAASRSLALTTPEIGQPAVVNFSAAAYTILPAESHDTPALGNTGIPANIITFTSTGFNYELERNGKILGATDVSKGFARAAAEMAKILNGVGEGLEATSFNEQLAIVARHNGAAKRFFAAAVEPAELKRIIFEASLFAAQGPQGVRSEVREGAAAGLKTEVLPASAVDVASAFNDLVYITGNLPEDSIHLSMVFDADYLKVQKDIKPVAEALKDGNIRVARAILTRLMDEWIGVGAAVSTVHPRKFQMLEEFIRELLRIGLFDQATADSLNAKILEKNQRLKSETQPIRVQRSEVRNIRQILQSFWAALPSNPIFHPFEAYYIRKISERLKVISHSVVTIFDLDDTLWDNKYRPKVYLMPPFLKALQANGHMAGAISDKLIIVDDVGLTPMQFAEMSETDRSQTLIERAKSSVAFRNNVTEPLTRLGVKIDDFDFFSLGILHEDQMYRYIRVHDRKDPKSEPVEMLFPFDMNDPDKNIPQASKLFAAKLIDLYMQRFFGKTDLAQAHLIMVGDNLKADHLAMANVSLLEKDGAYGQRLLSFMAQDEIGQRPLFGKGRSHVVPHFKLEEGRLRVGFGVSDTTGATFKVKDSIEEGTLLADIPHTVLRAIENIDDAEQERDVFVPQTTTDKKRSEVRTGNVSDLTGEMMANPSLAAGNRMARNLGAWQVSLGIGVPVISISSKRSEMRAKSPIVRSAIYAEGQATGSGQILGQATFFSPFLTEEILFPSLALDAMSAAEATQVIERFDELISRAEAGIRKASKGDEEEEALKLLTDQAEEIGRDWKRIREDLAAEEGDISPFADGSRMPDPFGLLIRKIREKREVDVSRGNVLNLLLDQVRAAALTLSRSNIDPELELRMAEHVISSKWKKFKSFVREKTKAQETLNKVQKKLKSEQGFEEALEEISRVASATDGVDDVINMMVEDFLRIVHEYYFGTPDAREKTLQRMREQGGGFNALFYNDVMFPGVQEIKTALSNKSVFEFRRAMKDPTMRKVANEIISVADDILASICSEVGRTFQSYELEGSGSGMNTALIVRDFMGASKAADLWEHHGHRIKAVVTDAATFTTHWVVFLKGVANPPLIIIIEDEEQRKQIDRIKPGDKVLVAVDPDTGKARMYLEPTSGQIEEAEEENLRLAMLNKAQRRQNSLSSGRIGIYANVSPGVDSGIKDSGADGTGLTRTEVDSVAEEFMIRMARFKAAGKEEEFLREADDFQRYLEQSYAEQSKDPSLRGKPNTWRAFDLWPDKNVDLFDILKELKLSDKPGFDFFRQALGAEILKRQVAAFLAIEARSGDTPAAERAVTRLMFPHVNSAEDARYLDEEILPGARQYAVASFGKKINLKNILEAEKNIRYGAMIETPEAVDRLKEILAYRTAGGERLFRFVSVGTNDMEIRVLSDWFKQKLSRDYPWVARFLKKLYPLYLKQYEKIIRNAKEFNEDPANVRPGEENVAVGFCGEVAGTDPFLAFLQDQDDRYNSQRMVVPLSASMSSSQIHHAKTLTRLPVDRGLRSLFDRGIHESEAKPDDPFHHQIAESVARRVKRAENALLFIESYQERYELAGLENVLHRTDMDVVSGIGSFRDFEFLSEMLGSLEGLRPPGEQGMGSEDLEGMLDVLAQRNITVPTDNAEIRDAFNFLQNIRDVWESLKKSDREKRYDGKLTRGLAPVFVEALGDQPWKKGLSKDQMVSEFYHQYYKHASVVFRTVSYVVTHYAKEVVPLKVIQEKKYQVAEPGKSVLEVDERLVEGPIFFTERGLTYGTYRFLDLEGASEFLATEPARVMNFLEYTVESLDQADPPRIGPETQKAIRRGRETLARFMEHPSQERDALRQSFVRLMGINAPLSYLVFRLNAFRLMSLLVPGFQEILYRFLDHSTFYPLHTQTVRAFNAMEGLPGQTAFVFSQVTEVYETLRGEPKNIQSLRLAMLLLDVIKYRWEVKKTDQTVFSNEERDAWVEEQVLDILSDMGVSDKTEIRAVTWLISQNIRLSVKDLLYSRELAAELLAVVGSLKEAVSSGLDAQEAKDLLGMLYVMRFSQRYAMVAPEQQVLLTQQGFNAPLPNHDKFYLYASYLLESGQTYDQEELTQIIHSDYEKFKKRESPAFSGFDRFTESASLAQELKKAAVSRESWNAYCAGMWPSDSIQGIIEGGFETLRREVLAPDFQTRFDAYLRGVTPYRAKALSSRELVREWVLLRHLQALALLKDRRRAQETVLTLFEPLGEAQGAGPVPYRVVFGTGYGDRDLEKIYTRVLFERGFDIARIWTNRFFEENENQGPIMGVAVGFFSPKPHVSVDQMLLEIREDLAKIFQVKHKVNSHLSQFFSPTARRITNRNEKVNDVYGPLVVKRPPDTSDFTTKVDFLEDRDNSSVLQITAVDRPGLLAEIFAILEEHFDFRITDPRSNDDEHVTCSFFISERQGNAWGPVSGDKKTDVVDTLKAMLNAEKATVTLNGDLRGESGEELDSESRQDLDLATDETKVRSEVRQPQELNALRQEVLEMQQILIHPSVEGQPIGVNSDVRIEDLKKNKPRMARQPYKRKSNFIASRQGWRNYDDLISILGRMQTEARRMASVREDDIAAALERVDRLVGEYGDERHPKDPREISVSVRENFLRALKRTRQDLVRWQDATQRQRTALKTLGADKYFGAEAALSWRNIRDYLKTMGPIWRIDLAEVADRYEDPRDPKDSKEGFYRVVRDYVSPRVGAWLASPLSKENLTEVKNAAELLHTWHKFTRVEGQLQDDFERLKKKDEDGLGRDLRERLYLLWEQLDFMIRSVENLPSQGELGLTEEKVTARSEMREINHRQRIAYLMSYVVNMKTMALLMAQDRDAVSMESLKSSINELVLLFRMLDVKEMEFRGEELFIPEDNDRIIVYERAIGFSEKIPGQVFKGPALEQLAAEVRFDWILEDFKPEIVELRGWKDSLAKKMAADLSPTDRRNIARMAGQILEKSQKTVARLNQTVTKVQKILVADDDVANRSLLENLLRRQGYTVLIAKNGAEAIKKLEDEHDIDFLITDFHMPEKTGGDILQAMAEGKLSRKIPSALISGGLSESTVDLRTFWAEGVYVEFIQKPNVLKPLMGILKRFEGVAEAPAAAPARSEGPFSPETILEFKDMLERANRAGDVLDTYRRDLTAGRSVRAAALKQLLVSFRNGASSESNLYKSANWVLGEIETSSGARSELRDYAKTFPRVLVVDDELGPRQGAYWGLQSLGYPKGSIVAVASGEEAIKLVEEGQTFDLLFVDFKMPGMRGDEVAKRLKLPTLVVTGNIHEAEEAFKSTGLVYRTVDKPYDLKDDAPERPSLKTHFSLLAETVESAKEKRSEVRQIKTILFVDNDESMRVVVLDRLRFEGYEVTTATGYKGAMAALQKQKFDLVITDIHMNDSDPYEETGVLLARTIHQENPAMPVMLLTAADPQPFMSLRTEGVIKMVMSKEESGNVLIENIRAIERTLPPVVPLGRSETRAVETILLVDDDTSLRMMLGDFLKWEKYEVIEAQNGEEALQKLKGSQVDFVLSDLQMPKMDGVQLAEAMYVSEEEGIKGIPIVIMTAASDLSRVQALQTEGKIKGVLPKPADPNAILGAIQQINQERLIQSFLAEKGEDSGKRSEIRDSLNRQRVLNLFQHDLNGKIGILLSADDNSDVSKERLREFIRETLVFFRIFDLEQFEARGGELFVPEGNENIFAYRIPSARSDRVYQTPTYGAQAKRQSFDKAALRQIAEEVGFDQIRNLFAADVKELEQLRDKLSEPGELHHELRVQARMLGEKILAKMRMLFSKLTMDAALVIAEPSKASNAPPVIFVSGYTADKIEGELREFSQRGFIADFLGKPITKDELVAMIDKTSERSGKKTERILLVDDEDLVRGLMARQLQHLGYVVVQAADGAEAWEKLKDGNFDLVITDLTMPKMGGIELARKIFGGARSEVRLASTAAYKESISKTTSVADVLSEKPWVVTAAEKIGVYSVRDIAAEFEGGITEDNIRKARLWISMKLLESMNKAEQEGQIVNERLQQFLAKIMASLPENVRAAVSQENVKGPQFHVNLAGLSEEAWTEFIRNFPVVLGLLVTLHARLSINVDAEGDALRSIQKKFDDLVAREGMTLASDQLRVFSATSRNHFQSFKASEKADAFMAREEGYLRSRPKNVSSFWITEDENRMDVLAAGIATALLKVASDKEMERDTTYRPSKFQALLAAVLNAIQGYLQIRTAA
jgi:two-component system chemotaxis response regulator CheY